MLNTSSDPTQSPCRSTAILPIVGIELTEYDCQSVCVPLGIIGILSDCFALTLILKEQGAGARWGVSGQRRHPPPGCKRTCTCDNMPLFHHCGLFPVVLAGYSPKPAIILRLLVYCRPARYVVICRFGIGLSFWPRFRLRTSRLLLVFT